MQTCSNCIAVSKALVSDRFGLPDLNRGIQQLLLSRSAPHLAGEGCPSRGFHSRALALRQQLENKRIRRAGPIVPPNLIDMALGLSR